MTDSNPQRSAAFFDLDRTLVAGSTLFQFGRAAYQAGILSGSQLRREAVENLQFRLRGSTDKSTASVLERVGALLAGVAVADVERIYPDILARVLPRVYPQVLAIAHEHMSVGRPVYICTAASQDLSSVIAQVLGFDGAIGTRAEVHNGLYTGALEGAFMYREGKAQALRELAFAQGIDLAASWAYSDSESDTPMLRAVGNPVAVNPDSVLKKIARAEGWEVLKFDHLARRIRIGMAAAAAVGGSAVVTRRMLDK